MDNASGMVAAYLSKFDKNLREEGLVDGALRNKLIVEVATIVTEIIIDGSG